MSSTDDGESTLPVKEKPEALVLRGKPQPTVRFRRGLIITLCGGVAVSIIALSWVALAPPTLRRAAAPIEKDGPAGAAGAEALRELPANYGDIPRLGPPLPGDLGRPILEHERELGDVPRPSFEADDEQRAEAEAERERSAAARSSAVIVQLGDLANVTMPPSSEQTAGGVAAAGVVSGKEQRTIGVASPATSDPNAYPAAQSAWTLSAGTVIPASLVTGLNSDVPGMVIAQVTENVCDSATGRTILIPQGARLLGNYNASPGYGQRRVLLVWKQISFPDGTSVRLNNLPATDASGYSGLHDRVDSHSWQLLKGIALSTLLGVGTQLSLGNDRSGLVRAIRESAQESAANAGDQITTRNLDVQPTLAVRPGWPVRAIVTSDLTLRPWPA